MYSRICAIVKEITDKRGEYEYVPGSRYGIFDPRKLGNYLLRINKISVLVRLYASILQSVCLLDPKGWIAVSSKQRCWHPY